MYEGMGNQNAGIVQTSLKVLLLPLLIVAGWSCTSDKASKESAARVADMANLPDNNAGEVVRKGIEVAGGWEKWTNQETMTYRKEIQYYDSTGAPTRFVSQIHQYRLQPQFQANISWQEEGNHIELVNNGESSWKLVNGEVQTTKADTNEAWNSTYGSSYVATMPFKLADAGVILTDTGTDTLPDGEIVHAVQVDYETWAGSAGGMHTWVYYFNAEDGMLTANGFKNNDGGIAFTDYTSFAKLNGVLLPGKRTSYSGSADLAVTPDSVTYHHENLRLNAPLPDSLFN